MLGRSRRYWSDDDGGWDSKKKLNARRWQIMEVVLTFFFFFFLEPCLCPRQLRPVSGGSGRLFRGAESGVHRGTNRPPLLLLSRDFRCRLRRTSGGVPGAVSGSQQTSSARLEFRLRRSVLASENSLKHRNLNHFRSFVPRLPVVPCQRFVCAASGAQQHLS